MISPAGVVERNSDRHRMLNPDNLPDAREDWLGEEGYLGRSLNTFFYARWHNLNTGKDERVDLDPYWGINTPEFTGLRIPQGYNYLAAYSLKSFQLGHLSSYCKLPTLPLGCPSLTLFFGFETQGGSMLGLSCFQFVCTPAKPTGTLYVKVGTALTGKLVDISSLMPGDAQIKDHRYQIKMDGDTHWFLIDGKIVATAAINSRDLGPIGPPPYAVFGVKDFYPSTMPAFAELCAGGYEATWPTSYAGFNVLDGEKARRTLDLYKNGSSELMRGGTIATGSLTSHPIPTQGYQTKTFNFMANQRGTLLMEVYLGSGEWRIYNSSTEDQWVTADQLFSYTMLGNAILSRVTFRPDVYPCTIKEAEVTLA